MFQHLKNVNMTLSDNPIQALMSSFYVIRRTGPKITVVIPELLRESRVLKPCRDEVVFELFKRFVGPMLRVWRISIDFQPRVVQALKRDQTKRYAGPDEQFDSRFIVVSCHTELLSFTL